MKISIDQVKPNVTRIVLDGSLAAAGVEAVQSEFNAAIAGASNAIVDLSKVPFIASLGLRLLVAGAQALAKQGGKMVLVSPAELSMRILKTTGLDQLMNVTGNLDDALAAF